MLSKWLFLFLLFMTLINIFSHNAGATTIKSTSRVTDDAQVNAQKELEGCTGETDSVSSLTLGGRTLTMF